MRLCNILLMIVLSLSFSQRAMADTLPKADEILIKKADHKLILLREGKPLKTYHVSLGPNPKGPKTQAGDGKTPEGHYSIDSRNAFSHYHRSLHVSYPSPTDRKRAAKLHVNPGGDIMIHGLPNGYGGIGKGHLLHDWTAGCIAVTDEEIEEIWKLVPDGTPVNIEP